jgi:hypothetical protein
VLEAVPAEAHAPTSGCSNMRRNTRVQLRARPRNVLNVAYGGFPRQRVRRASGRTLVLPAPGSFSGIRACSATRQSATPAFPAARLARSALTARPTPVPIRLPPRTAATAGHRSRTMAACRQEVWRTWGAKAALGPMVAPEQAVATPGRRARPCKTGPVARVGGDPAAQVSQCIRANPHSSLGTEAGAARCVRVHDRRPLLTCSQFARPLTIAEPDAGQHFAKGAPRRLDCRLVAGGESGDGGARPGGESRPSRTWGQTRQCRSPVAPQLSAIGLLSVSGRSVDRPLVSAGLVTRCQQQSSPRCQRTRAKTCRSACSS